MSLLSLLYLALLLTDHSRTWGSSRSDDHVPSYLISERRGGEGEREGEREREREEGREGGRERERDRETERELEE